jgi:hypothetical protein
MSLPQMHDSRVHHSLLRVGNKLIVVGGRTNASKFCNNLDIFDLATKTYCDLDTIS